MTEMDNVLFSAMSHNPAALHLDEEYCREHTEFGKRIVNSAFTLGLVVGISVGDTTLGTTIGNLGLDEVRFPRRCSMATRCTRRPRSSAGARANRGRMRASSCSSTAATTSATSWWPGSGEPRLMLKQPAA